VTGSTYALLYVARLIASARDELGALSGPLAAHWAWRAAVCAAQGAQPWERPEAVLRGVRAALAVAEQGGPGADREDWPWWERRGRVAP
jgi:hypothetical protein